jgi:O-antigen ligase
MKKSSNIFLYIFSALYLIVHFVPDLDGADVMGAQWLYTSGVDLLVLGYIAFNYKFYKEAINGVFNIKFTLVYSLFLLWALGSYYYALNGTEALVCLARLVSTFLIFMNLSILLHKKDVREVYKTLALLVSLVLLYDGFNVIVGFSNKVGDMSLDSLVISLMGNNGNKNVMAASLLIKFPFAIYYILNTKIAGKAIGIVSLFIGVFALFILNTRSTFVGLFLILLIFTLTTVSFKRKAGVKSILIQLAFFIIPIAVAFFSANMVLDNAVKMQGEQGGYGTVTKRVGDITIAKGSDRIHLWSAAIDYFKKNPLKGAGYGNWKLASIPYEKEYTNDLFVPYHSHNDFLETFADLGVVGGSLYALLYLLVLLFTIRIWRDQKLKQYHFVATISFMAITCYFVDAFLNFPTERTSMQTMLTFSAALVFAPYSLIHLHHKENNKGKLQQWVPKIFVVFSLLILVPSIYINKQVFESLKVQKYVMGEIDADPKMALADVKDAFPHFPNLSTSTLPIKALVARYYYRDKMYDEALSLLRECEKDNPYLYYTDFIKTAVFASKQNYDSVSFYSKRAFYNWPRATSYYKNVIFGAARKKDTSEINKAFSTYIKYRNEPEGWNQYLLARFELMGGGNKLSQKLLDSAIKLFPKDSTTFVRVRGLFASSGAIAPASNDFLTKGMQAFQKGQYAAAAQLYLKAAEVDPSNYTNYENVGICYYSAKQFEKALPYFEKASRFATANTGKSEFYVAMCLISVGKKDQACGYLQAAKQKHYPSVDQYIASNCK